MVPLYGVVDSALSESSLKMLAAHEALHIMLTYEKKTVLFQTQNLE